MLLILFNILQVSHQLTKKHFTQVIPLIFFNYMISCINGSTRYKIMSVGLVDFVSYDHQRKSHIMFNNVTKIHWLTIMLGSGYLHYNCVLDILESKDLTDCIQTGDFLNGLLRNLVRIIKPYKLIMNSTQHISHPFGLIKYWEMNELNKTLIFQCLEVRFQIPITIHHVFSVKW